MRHKTLGDLLPEEEIKRGVLDALIEHRQGLGVVELCAFFRLSWTIYDKRMIERYLSLLAADGLVRLSPIHKPHWGPVYGLTPNGWLKLTRERQIANAG